MSDSPAYLDAGPGRDRWILERRPPRNVLDPLIPYAMLNETEPDGAGGHVPIATVFLTNRECPWRCVMCDLWKNTLVESAPPGAIPSQIDHALDRLSPSKWIKLYNAGSFFDAHAIPISDLPRISDQVRGFDRVIVECHPALVGPRVETFAQHIAPARLEIAMGLETANPVALHKLNKRMTRQQFVTAAQFLKERGLSLRVFVLVKPPFVAPLEAEDWSRRSVDFAFDYGARVVSLIATRAGNGAMEALAAAGDFQAPTLAELEAAADYGVGLHRGVVLADLWDTDGLAACQQCRARRTDRLAELNRMQSLPPPILCPNCITGQQTE